MSVYDRQYSTVQAQQPYAIRPPTLRPRTSTSASPTTSGPEHTTESETTTEDFYYMTTDGGFLETSQQPTHIRVTKMTTDNPDDKELDAGAIVGIVIACLFVVGAIVGVVVYMVVVRRRSRPIKKSVDAELQSKPKPTISSPQSAVDQEGYMVPIEHKFYKLDRVQESQQYITEGDYVVPVDDVYYEIPADLPEPPQPPKRNIYDTPDQGVFRTENAYTPTPDDKGYLDLRTVTT